MIKKKLNVEFIFKNADIPDQTALGSLMKDNWEIKTVKPGLYFSTVNLEKRI